MGKKKRRPHLSGQAKPGASPAQSEPAASKPLKPVPSIRRQWMFRLVTIVVAPIFILALIEIGLRVFGYGHATSFFVKMRDGTHYTANRYFGWQFFSQETSTYPHPFVMPTRKQPGTFRIFILGESAALGTPAPPFGFGRILEVMLRDRYPDRQFEIINAAMRGVDSNIILPIAKECAKHDPDLFIVYMGNNEAVGRYAPEPDSRNLRTNLKVIRTERRIKATRSGQWLDAILRKLRPEHEKKIQDMEFFRKHRLATDDPRRESVYKNFRANLEDICQARRKSGARVIVSTVAANLKDFPPLASLHRTGLTETDRARWESLYADGAAAETAKQFEKAIPLFVEAQKIDDHFAELHFRLARCYLASGETSKARVHYGLARDWDALQFRTDSRMNRIIRDAASSHSGGEMLLVDAENALASASEHQIPGQPLFNDHVHFSFDGDYLMAQVLLTNVAAMLNLSQLSGVRALPTRAECAEALAFTSWEEVNISAGVVKSMANPPFLDQLDHKERQPQAEQAVQQAMRQFTRERLEQIAGQYRAATARNPNDWQLHFTFANFFLFAFQDYSAAAEELKVVVRLIPEGATLRQSLGHALLRAGKSDEALGQFHEILRFDPAYTPAKDGIAQVEARRRGRELPLRK